MKLVTFTRTAGDEPAVGLLTAGGVVDLTFLLPGDAGVEPMIALIEGFAGYRHELDRLARSNTAIPFDQVRLHPPVRRPGKILCCIGNYWEHAQREPRPLNMFLKSPEAVVGPDDVVRLPTTREPWMFMHEAELAVVVAGPAKDVETADWRSAVFGFTCFIDVTARGEGRMTWRSGSWIGKSFDTFAPLGPCILTADEIADPHDLRVRLWNNDELRHDYVTSDMEHRIPEIVAFASSVMTLKSGDILACGTNHEGLGAVQHGDALVIEVERIGTMAVAVEDPLGRSWERGVYLGADSTHHAAIRHHHPEMADKLCTTDRNAS